MGVVKKRWLHNRHAHNAFRQPTAVPLRIGVCADLFHYCAKTRGLAGSALSEESNNVASGVLVDFSIAILIVNIMAFVIHNIGYCCP